MFKKILSVLLSVIMIITFFTAWPFTSNAEEVDIAEEGINVGEEADTDLAESGAITQSDFNSRINSLRNDYPNGFYWDGSFDGGIQCYGFARLVAYNVFYSHVNSWSVSYSLDGVKAGDVVQYGNTSGNGHTIFVLSVSGSTIRYVDCNGNGGYCRVRWDDSITIGAKIFGWYSFSYRYVSPGVDPGPETLRVGVSGSHAYMSWDWDGNADYYNIKLWRNKVWEGDPYRVVWSVKSNEYGFALPKGTYQAYVDACNDHSGYCKMSNVITFTIGDSDVNLNVGVSGSYAWMTWNKDSKADYYNIKIWRNFIWDGDPYRVVWSVKDTEYGLALPKGKYQVFVDACNDKTGYCKMSSVAEITIGNSDVNLNVSVSGSYAWMTWNKDSKADYYNIKIWRNFIWDGDPYRVVWSVKNTEYGLALPKGKYQVFVDACNDKTGYCKMSSVVEFTVGDSEVTLNAGVTGSQVDFSWNRDSNAQYYNLKIWRNYIWDGKEYQIVWSIKNTNQSLALPEGTYQAFVDACNDNTGYCKMSSVVEFTVEKSTEPPTEPPTINPGDDKVTILDHDGNKHTVSQGEIITYIVKLTADEPVDHLSGMIYFNRSTLEPIITNDLGYHSPEYDNVQLQISGSPNEVKFDLSSNSPVALNNSTVLRIQFRVSSKGGGSYLGHDFTTEEFSWENIDHYGLETHILTNQEEHVPSTEPSPSILGDADGDGVVTVIDATTIQKKLASISVPIYIEVAADVDGDKVVTVLDATYIQKHLAHMDIPFEIGKIKE